jgi:hypothetical protein
MGLRTKGTVPLYTELPRELSARLRAFAKRDRRTIRAELVRAVEMLLSAEDAPAGAEGKEAPRGT